MRGAGKGTRNLPGSVSREAHPRTKGMKEEMEVLRRRSGVCAVLEAGCVDKRGEASRGAGAMVLDKGCVDERGEASRGPARRLQPGTYQDDITSSLLLLRRFPWCERKTQTQVSGAASVLLPCHDRRHRANIRALPGRLRQQPTPSLHAIGGKKGRWDGARGSPSGGAGRKV